MCVDRFRGSYPHGLWNSEAFRDLILMAAIDGRDVIVHPEGFPKEQKWGGVKNAGSGAIFKKD